MVSVESQHLHDTAQTSDDTEGAVKYLLFRLGDEEYGIRVSHVREIIGMRPVTELPDSPAYVKGIINLRGKVIPVLDVRLRFNLEELDHNERTCIIVVDVERLSVGLIVDTVSEVVDIPPSQVEMAPTASAGSAGCCIEGLGKVGKAVKILLDTSKLLLGEGAARENTI